MNPDSSTALAPFECRVLFGSGTPSQGPIAGSPCLHVGLPVLAGTGVERLLTETSEPSVRGGFTVFQRESLQAGFAVAAPGVELESAARGLYDRLLEVTEGLHLYRIWNYVPQINASTGGMENYRLFCRGRSLAFEGKYGTGFRRMLPAASAVGMQSGSLAVGFFAGHAIPNHFENPRQTPAFEYPPKFGPRPPSFSRATAVSIGAERRVYISGTAAIRGHDSVADHKLDGQLRCTVENLALIGQASGVGPDLGKSNGWQRAFRVFLRDPADLGVAKATLDRDLFHAGDGVSYMQADICRSELLVEIEATLVSRS
jgi:chorismate lyase / 3-hydroxybenzoate synthase